MTNYLNSIFTPKEGFRLCVAACTVNNARTTDVQLDWSPYSFKTMVANDSGASYPWEVFDIPSTSFVSRPLAPGSSLDFNICFAVPKASTPQSLIVTLKELNEKKGQEARISLPPQS